MQSLNEKIHRIVEGQSYIATRQLVDSDEKQQILEEILEGSKPKYLEGTEDFHYLLKTPFRYPPLEYGSRFGGKNESGIFYGSLELKTAFTEAAYYRFRFIMDTKAMLSPGFIDYTSFFTLIKTQKALNLIDISEQEIARICDPFSYKYSQEIGSKARYEGIEAILFFSARTKQKSQNIAVFSPNALQNKKLPDNQLEHWKCYVDQSQVTFTHHWNKNKYHFDFQEFFIGGKFPIAR